MLLAEGVVVGSATTQPGPCRFREREVIPLPLESIFRQADFDQPSRHGHRRTGARVEISESKAAIGIGFDAPPAASRKSSRRISVACLMLARFADASPPRV
ncbi:MAG TPA: hypothetical protein VMW57_10560 [Methyloceanibacter sp.]|nr:hypothetical protein [Methyloceanibacter sp.]